MAKVQIHGQSVVITSSVKLEDLKTIEEYRPDALVLYGGEDNKEEIFRVGTTTRSAGTISDFGVEFGGATHDDNKFATVTLAIDFDSTGDALKEEIANAIGVALVNLNKVEAKLNGELEDIAEEKQKIFDSITII